MEIATMTTRQLMSLFMHQQLVVTLKWALNSHRDNTSADESVHAPAACRNA